MNTKHPLHPSLSPASCVTFSPLRATRKKSHAQIVISEISVQEEDSPTTYDATMQHMREKFNATYYNFLSKIMNIAVHANLLKFHEKDIRSLFTDLIEMKLMIEEGPKIKSSQK